MRKFFYTLIIMVSSLAFGQEEVPFEILGAWANLEGEVLTVNRDADKIVFVRKDSKRIKATGTIEMVDGDLHINRFDNQDSYRLGFFIGNETMVITKPRSPRAWLWVRIQ